MERKEEPGKQIFSSKPTNPLPKLNSFFLRVPLSAA